MVSLWQFNSINILSLLSMYCPTSFLQKDSTGIFSAASDAIFLYPLYQLLGKHQIFYRINLLKAERFPPRSVLWLTMNSVIFGSSSPSVHYREMTSALPTGDVTFCPLLGTCSKENIYKRACTHPMLPSRIQETDLKSCTFTFSDCFQVTPPEQNPKKNESPACLARLPVLW